MIAMMMMMTKTRNAADDGVTYCSCVACVLVAVGGCGWLCTGWVPTTMSIDRPRRHERTSLMPSEGSLSLSTKEDDVSIDNDHQQAHHFNIICATQRLAATATNF